MDKSRKEDYSEYLNTGHLNTSKTRQPAFSVLGFQMGIFEIQTFFQFLNVV
jgi:hypothetical protein